MLLLPFNLFKKKVAAAAATFTFDPATMFKGGGTGATLSNGNLTITADTSNNNMGAFSTTAKSSGKYYVEFLVSVLGVEYRCGISNVNNFATGGHGYNYLGDLPGQLSWKPLNGGVKSNNATIATVQSGATVNDRMCVAIDVDNKKVWYRLNNGNWNNDVLANQNPATNTGGLQPSDTSGSWFFAVDVVGDATSQAQLSLKRVSSDWLYSAPSGFTDWSVVPAGSPLLDSLTATSTVAYSTRKLRSAYSGYCMKVRRDSDNTTQDIGFDSNGNLNTASLLTFVGSGSGFIDTWYDQSTSGINAIQPTTAKQPRIVNAGVVDMFNGNAAIRWSGGTTYLVAAITTTAQPLSFAIAAQYNSVINDRHFTDAGTNRMLVGNASGWYTFYAGTVQTSTVSADTKPHSFVAVFNGSGVSSVLYLDGTSIVSGDTGPNYIDGSGQFIGAATNQSSIDGWIGDYILFPSSLGSTDRSTIQTSHRNYWVTSYPLDEVSTPASSAYSIRKVRSAYAGSALRVRRSQDNTEQDIGFDAVGNLDQTALTNFVGAGSGYVSKWYDQSGNGRDAVQATAASQPRIVNAGTVATKGGNGRVSIQFIATDGLAGFKFSAPSTAFSVSVVGSYDGVNYNMLGSDGVASTSGLYLQPYNGGSAFAAFNRSGAATSVSLPSTPPANTLETFLLTHDASNNATAYLNGTAGTTVNAINWTASADTVWHIGGYPSSPVYDLGGYISEHISFTGVLTGTDCASLQSSQKTYFGTA